MNVEIVNGRIVDPASGHDEPGGLYIANGRIAGIGAAPDGFRADRTLNARGAVVAPGLVETEMGRRLMKATAGVDDLRALDATMPFGRVCQPEDVANAVRWLVSDRAAYITGEKINVYGGAS